MNENILLKSFPVSVINDDEMRKFQCWGSVEIVDKHNEIIPAEEVYKIMDIWMDRGAPIMYNHSNRVVGKGLNWQPLEKNGKKGVLITGIIFKHYKEDDEIWEGIKKGKFEGLSIGGKSYRKETDAEGHSIIKDIIGYEFSVVDKIGNQEATFVEVNTMAKSDNIKTEDIKKEDIKKEDPVIDEPSESSDVNDRITQLESVLNQLIEKIAAIEDKIAGKPEDVEEPLEEVDKQMDEVEKPEEDKKPNEVKKPVSEKQEEVNKECKPKSTKKTDSIEKRLNTIEKDLYNLKKGFAVKSIEAERPSESINKSQNDNKLTEIRKSLLNMSKKGRIDFEVLGKMVRG